MTINGWAWDMAELDIVDLGKKVSMTYEAALIDNDQSIDLLFLIVWNVVMRMEVWI